MKLIIFDMDGTLIDSGNVITNTINFVRENLGLEKLSKTIVLEALNDPTINSAEYFYGTSYFTDFQTELFSQYYDEHCVSDIVLYEGIAGLLKELKDEYRLSVATNANTQYAIKMLDFLGIKDCFDLIVGADMVSNPKPHPDMLMFTCKELQIEKQNTILVGDSKKDTNAALSFGIDYILVNWGFTNHTLEENAISKVEHLKEEIYKKGD